MYLIISNLLLPVDVFLLKSCRILFFILTVKLKLFTLVYKALPSLGRASSLTSSYAIFLLVHQTETTVAIKHVRLISTLEHPCCCCCLEYLFPGLLLFKFQVRYHFPSEVFSGHPIKTTLTVILFHSLLYFLCSSYLLCEIILFIWLLGLLPPQCELHESRLWSMLFTAVVPGLKVQPGI